MRGRIGRLVAGVPRTTPFVAPEALERRSGAPFRLRLGANESAFGPSPLALEAAARELSRAAWYGDPESHELRARLTRETGAPASRIVVGSGIDDLLGLVVRCVTDPGDAIVAARGTYATFGYHVRAYGAVLQTAPYRPDGRVDLDALARLAHERGARAVYVANPDNPTGTHHDDADLAALAARLPPTCALLVDEAYADFVDPPRSGAPLAADARILRFRTFSKGHGLAGLRIGYVLASEEYVAAFERVRVQFGVNRVAQAAALAALDDHEHVARVRREVARGRAEYRALGQRLGWRPLASQTNFVAFDVGGPHAVARWVAALERQRVFVRRGCAPPLDDCLRITVGTAQERARLAEALAVAGELETVP